MTDPGDLRDRDQPAAHVLAIVGQTCAVLLAVMCLYMAMSATVFDAGRHDAGMMLAALGLTLVAVLIVIQVCRSRALSS